MLNIVMKPPYKCCCKQLNVKAHFISPNVNDITQEHQKAIKAMEFLLMALQCLDGIHKLTKSKKIKVTIDGQGADEQLGGYLHYFHSYIASSSIFNLFQNMYHCLKIPGSRNFVIRGFILKIISIVIGKNNTELLLNKLGISFSFNLNETLAKQFQQSLVNLLYNADRQSMAHSVESRLPFMDYRLVEFYSLFQHVTKYIKDGQNILQGWHLIRSFRMRFVGEKIKWVGPYQKRYGLAQILINGLTSS